MRLSTGKRQRRCCCSCEHVGGSKPLVIEARPTQNEKTIGITFNSGARYNKSLTIDWGDGTSSSTGTGGTPLSFSKVYDNPGSYVVKASFSEVITGIPATTCPYVYLNVYGNCPLDIVEWGDIVRVYFEIDIALSR